MLKGHLAENQPYSWNISPQRGWEMILRTKAATPNGTFPYLWHFQRFLTSDFDLECCSVVLRFTGIAPLVLLSHLLDDELALCPLGDDCCPLVLLHLSLILLPYDGSTCS